MPKLESLQTIQSMCSPLALKNPPYLFHQSIILIPPRKKQVIRVRVETEQFLLYCVKIETLVRWMQSLSIAIDLAVPLDDRNYPVDNCLPRRQRRIPTQGRAFQGQSNIRCAPRLTYVSIPGSELMPRVSNSRTISNSNNLERGRRTGNECSHRSLRNSIRKSFLNLRSSPNKTTQSVAPLSELDLAATPSSDPQSG